MKNVLHMKESDGLTDGYKDRKTLVVSIDYLARQRSFALVPDESEKVPVGDVVQDEVNMARLDEEPMQLDYIWMTKILVKRDLSV